MLRPAASKSSFRASLQLAGGGGADWPAELPLELLGAAPRRRVHWETDYGGATPPPPQHGIISAWVGTVSPAAAPGERLGPARVPAMLAPGPPREVPSRTEMLRARLVALGADDPLDEYWADTPAQPGPGDGDCCREHHFPACLAAYTRVINAK
jgi:hypothetical protein